MSLVAYRKKRNFASTREPTGVTAAPSSRSGARFVIQKHAARRLHYDFRLEVDGVLKSWAVPNGVPVAAGDKRLAIEVEDHPLEYGGFEGTIAEGNYGAGTVMLWDRGTYRPLRESSPAAGLREGRLDLELSGRKLKGSWVLIRMRARDDEDKKSWLLIKTGTDARVIAPGARDVSVKTGRTLKQIAGGDAHPKPIPAPHQEAVETRRARRTVSTRRRRTPAARSRSQP